MDIQFTEEQQSFLRSAEDGLDVLVDACIGSGKTTAIQAACGVLAGRGKRVLYLTYNRRLLEEARKRIDPKDADVETFHSFGGRMLNAAHEYAGSEREVPMAFVSRLKSMPRYDAVVVDEYQDLSEDLKDMLWHVIRLSVNGYGFAPQFLMVGDRDQKIMDHTSIDAQAAARELMAFLSMAHGREHEEMMFTRCFRLGADYAAKIGQAWGKSIVGMNPACETKKMSLGSAAAFLAKFEPKDILVLGNNMSWGKRVELQNLLESRWSKKFNKDTVYSSVTDRDGDRRGLDTSECAVFTTYDSAKGMERKVCVVCNFDPGYLDARLKHQTDRKVLKNLFLVAASRGKDYNIILSDGRAETLTFSRIAAVDGDVPADMRPDYMSTMFDFKFREDVDRCLEMVRTETVQGPGNEIEATSSVGQIDLSPCVGYYAQAVYFEGYDIDGAIDDAWQERAAKGNFPKLPLPDGRWPLWRKVLYLTALTTGQERYFRQVDKPYISKKASDALCARLGERLGSGDASERPCQAVFRGIKDKLTGKSGGEKILLGRMDVMRNGMPWELKFVQSPKAEHVLQAAVYAACCGSESAALWNIRTDELLDVQVPDREAFLSAVLSCISKRRLSASQVRVEAMLEDGHTERRVLELA